MWSDQSIPVPTTHDCESRIWIWLVAWKCSTLDKTRPCGTCFKSPGPRKTQLEHPSSAFFCVSESYSSHVPSKHAWSTLLCSTDSTGFAPKVCTTRTPNTRMRRRAVPSVGKLRPKSKSGGSCGSGSLVDLQWKEKNATIACPLPLFPPHQSNTIKA